MSDGVGYGRGLVRLVTIPAFLGVAASIAPMAFGRTFAWHLGLITLLLATICAVAFRAWRSRNEDDEDDVVRTESVVGHIDLQSEAVLIGDGLSMRSRVRLDHLPAGRWEVRCIVERSGDSEQLAEVMLACGATGDESRDERTEVVIDSGRLVVIDATAALGTFEPGKAAVEVAEGATDGRPPLGVVFLRDATGRPRGFVVEPPYGDGAYEVQVEQRASSIRVRLSL